MKQNQGFTIMELMVAVAIVGILAAIAVPNFLAYIPKHRLNQGARTVFSALQYARVTAVKDQIDVVIDFNTGSDSFNIFIDDGRGGGVAVDGVQNGSEPTVKSGTLSSGVEIQSASFSGAVSWTRYDSRGMPNNIGAVRLRSTSQTQHMREISVPWTGMPRTKISTNGGSSWQEV